MLQIENYTIFNQYVMESRQTVILWFMMKRISDVLIRRQLNNGFMSEYNYAYMYYIFICLYFHHHQMNLCITACKENNTLPCLLYPNNIIKCVVLALKYWYTKFVEFLWKWKFFWSKIFASFLHISRPFVPKIGLILL